MENNRGQSIFLSVVGIATLLVAIVGATFAYFSISVTGNETASSIIVTTAKLGGVTFNGTGAGVEVTDVYPGWTETKQFTISTAADADPSASIQYQIYLVTNTDAKTGDTSKDLAAAASTKGDFTYSISGSTSNGGGTVADSASNQNMPAADGNTLLGTGTLTGASAVHTYDFTILLKESSTDQNELQGKSYYGIIQIVVATSQGLRTWDTTNNNGWVPYPAN